MAATGSQICDRFRLERLTSVNPKAASMANDATSSVNRSTSCVTVGT